MNKFDRALQKKQSSQSIKDSKILSKKKRKQIMAQSGQFLIAKGGGNGEKMNM
jgi:hypothetical protein